MTDWRGKRVTVVGLGIEGIDLVRFFCKQGALVTVSDSRPASALSRNLEQIRHLPVRLSLGENHVEDTVTADAVFVSQSVPLSIPAIAAARSQGIPISSMTRLFLELCPAPVVGITGSSGKTTTTSLVGAIFAAAQKPHFVGGNIGVGLLSRLEEITPETWVVLEISHTQLELLTRSPHVACITNVTPNHLDQYSWEEYQGLKQRILAFQGPEDYAVLNADDQITLSLAKGSRARRFYFSSRGPIAGDGVALRDDHLVRRQGRREEPIIAIGNIPLRGQHNVENAAAAAAIAALCGIKHEAIAQGIRSFTAVPHRLELVGYVGGAAYYNDSIATTPERALAGIRSFDETLVLLLGGRHKNLPLEELAQEACRRCRAVIFFGEAAPLLAEAVSKAARNSPSSQQPQLVRVHTLAEAVEAARRAAQPGDVVLLSPACTSFDAYANFEERGQEFRRLVQLLAQEE